MRKFTTGLVLLVLSAATAGCNKPTQRTTNEAAVNASATAAFGNVGAPGNSISGSRGNTDHRLRTTAHGNTDHGNTDHGNTDH